MTLSHFHIFFHCTEKKTQCFSPKSFVLWWSFKFYFLFFFWLPFYNHFCYYIQIFHFGPIFCTKIWVIFVQSFSGKTKVNEVFLLRFLNKFFSLFFFWGRLILWNGVDFSKSIFIVYFFFFPFSIRKRKFDFQFIDIQYNMTIECFFLFIS